MKSKENEESSSSIDMDELQFIHAGDDDRIKRLIRKTFLQCFIDKEPLPDMDFFSSVLNVSPITIRRRLARNNVRYKQLKSSFRREIAMQMLLLSSSPIDKISEELGYSEPTSFYRAFKQWTGLTPQSYRTKSVRLLSAI